MAYLNDAILGAYKRISEMLGFVRVSLVDETGVSVAEKTSKYKTEYVDIASATITYICAESSGAEWLAKKINTTSGTQISYATIKNNPTVLTYSAAKTARATLTYGTPSQAL